MKTILRTAAIAALVITASCGKDSADDTEQQQQLAEQLENTPLEANIVSDNVLIEGATKEEGMPPTPNEAITLDASKSGKTAFLNEGFEISLNSDADIVGAYLQFKTSDGTLAESYHDINIASNISGKSSIGSTKNKKGAFAKIVKVDDTTLDIDFNNQIEPGKFCYVVCVYDGEGNISAPSEVCVTVESWGGNSSLVGSWNLTKQEDTEEGETEVELVGEEKCYTNTVHCDSQEILEYDDCYTTELGNIIFNADGSFTTEFNGSGTDINHEASGEQCKAIFNEDEEDSDLYKGFWAYSADTSRLTLVAYENTYTIADDIEKYTYEAGDGELLFDGVIQLNGNSFIITEEDGSDQDVDYSYKLYFEKN